ncbi:MAG: methyltransferase domain-containing protein [Myxococcales bacterium]|nr:methyltransferase domain-containing protein [Myxococcales bacterium]
MAGDSNHDADAGSEATRLERLWAGGFGDAYVERNRIPAEQRLPFWRDILAEFPARRVLEVGCNLGGNLAPIAQVIDPTCAFGVDVNQKALQLLRASVPGVNAVSGAARELPFRDRWFDMTFTMGVLIHQSPEALPVVMSEVVRCSSRFVLCGEYYSEEPTVVSYRGEERALFKRDFGALYRELFPELRLRRRGHLTRAEGWDDVTYWVFERS